MTAVPMAEQILIPLSIARAIAIGPPCQVRITANRVLGLGRAAVGDTRDWVGDIKHVVTCYDCVVLVT